MEPATSHQPTRSSKLEPTANLRPAVQRLETLARNATEVEDNPAHDAVDNFIASARAVHQTDNDARGLLWGHDHDGAHRQLAVRDPHDTYMVLLTSSG